MSGWRFRHPGFRLFLFLLVFLFLGCIPMSVIWYVSISASDEPFEMGKTETGSFRMKVGNSRVWFFEDFNESSMIGYRASIVRL